MRYIPDLIPKNRKVLPDYFKGNPYVAQKSNPLLAALGWFFGLGLLLSALASLNHPLLGVFFGLLGFILLPPGHRWLERQLHFRFTTAPKSLTVLALFLAAIPLSSHYAKLDNQEKIELERQAAIQKQKEQAQRHIAEAQAKQRNDSLNAHIRKSNYFAAKHKIALAEKQLEAGAPFATDSSGQNQLAQARAELAFLEVKELLKAGKYQATIPKLTSFLAVNGSNKELLYNRAFCYSRVNKMQLAVNDCKTAMELGSKEATRLYNKINPVRRRVSYYATRCCDGSESSAKGRGACSHHGGVCNWNDPVYEEYRQYE